ncbi:hypothetical protein HL667_14935 [Bradyrhizobium sp. 83012]|uniref:Uncharacterized protein n=1 Tax=Bradyrhizobium aeschynomenes TaxID=2734909 RepID=A0ABX2CG98_9BRAD|nr:hypothetical protein [Bradyrhizobium aeschynomenes]NPU66297.1 hypothetical protein [Bradyrhizobium aeschynomenes]NPV20007.1 hypothetical protein [Bradyrhizobium aeschynomenes]
MRATTSQRSRIFWIVRFGDIIEQLSDTAAKSIDQVLDTLPKDFPGKIADSVADGAKRRIATLSTAKDRPD